MTTISKLLSLSVPYTSMAISMGLVGDARGCPGDVLASWPVNRMTDRCKRPSLAQKFRLRAAIK